MFKIWLKLFLKNIKNHRINFVVNLLGLTLGFSGLLLVTLYFNDENSYNKWMPDAENMYRVLHFTEEEGIWETSTVVEGEKYLNEIPEVEEVYLSDSWYNETLLTIGKDKVYTTKIIEGDSNFFSFFPFEITYGQLADFKSDILKIALSEQQALIFFNTKNAIGKEITIDNQIFKIVLVYKGNSKSFFNPNMVINLPNSRQGHWGSFSQNLFCKLKPGSQIKDVEAKMFNIFRTYSFKPGAKKEGMALADYEAKYGLFVKLEKLSDTRLKSEAYEVGPEGKGNYRLIIIMLTLSLLLILISCVNFINLSLATAGYRGKEVGVKKTLGLTKTNLGLQYFAEIGLQVLLAFVLSMICVELLLPSFNLFLDKTLTIYNPPVIGVLLLVCLFIISFVGSIPTLFFMKFDPKRVLKGNTTRSKKGVRIQHLMLGLQILISGFFLISSISIQKQVEFMLEKNLGFNGDQILLCDMNGFGDKYKQYLTLKQELIKHKGIEAITSNFHIPGGGSTNSTNVNYKNEDVNMNGNPMDFNYFETLEIELVKGRGLSSQFTSDTINKVLINETAIEKLGLPIDPIGYKLNIGFNLDIKYEIVGVVKDYHVDGFDRKIEPMFFFHWKTFKHMTQNFNNTQFKVKAKNIKETIAFIETYWDKHIQGGYPFDYTFLDDHFTKSFNEYQNQKTIFNILTYVVIFISLLGLFALATLTIQSRLKEVAIRKTLGATVPQIMLPLMINFIKITAYTSLIMIPVSYFFIDSWLSQFIYKIDIPWYPFLLCPIVLMVMVILVVGIKAYYATKVNLIQYLKFE